MTRATNKNRQYHDSDVIEAVDEALDRQRIMRQLMANRAALGLSQNDVAESMGCTQSRISKMENSADDDLRFGDLRQYAHVVDCELKAGIRPKHLEPAEEVKCLAFAVNERLSRMADLAQSDDKISAGVARFFFEAFVNFSAIIGRAVNALPRNSDGTPIISMQFHSGVERGEPRDCNASPESDSVEKPPAEEALS